MIIHYNVCDQCGDKDEIVKGQFSGIGIEYDVYSVKVPSGFSVSNIFKPNKTFCCKNCMIEYFKTNINDDGSQKGDPE